jgi:hypothetical protein
VKRRIVTGAFIAGLPVFLCRTPWAFQTIKLLRQQGKMYPSLAESRSPGLTSRYCGVYLGQTLYISLFLVVHPLKTAFVCLIWGVTTEAMEYEEVARNESTEHQDVVKRLVSAGFEDSGRRLVKVANGDVFVCSTSQLKSR